jgi:hypothetical protein
MNFVDCPAYLDDERTLRCGLPAEVRCRFTMRSTGGLLEAAMTRCPAGHWFNGPLESLIWDSTNNHGPGTAPVAATARQASLPRAQDGRDSRGGSARPESLAGPGLAVRRPNCAPAYYLGRPPTDTSPPCAATAPQIPTSGKPSPVAGKERRPQAVASCPAPGQQLPA